MYTATCKIVYWKIIALDQPALRHKNPLFLYVDTFVLSVKAHSVNFSLFNVAALVVLNLISDCRA